LSQETTGQVDALFKAANAHLRRGHDSASCMRFSCAIRLATSEHATSALPERTYSGIARLHCSVAKLQRGWNGQPDGTFFRDGMEPGIWNSRAPGSPIWGSALISPWV